MKSLIDAILIIPRSAFAVGAILFAAMIWYFSSRTWEGAERHLPGGFGNLMHLVLFGGLASLLLFSFRRDRSIPARIMNAVLFAGIWGLVDEIHQFHVPGRTCSIFDLFDDLMGAAAASTICAGVFFARRRTIVFTIGAAAFLGAGILGALVFGERWPNVDGILARGVAFVHSR